MKHPIEISVVSPVYRAADIVDKLVERISEEVSKITPHYEIILVEDRGPDNSWEKIQENCKKHPKLKGIRLSKNCGQQHAMQCGLEASSGAFVITMDCDLQDDPGEIHKLYAKANEGYDIVVARRMDRQDNFLKRFLSNRFNSVLGYLTETEQDSTVANFVVMNRKVVDALTTMGDKNRYYPMMIQWIGFNKTKVDIQHSEREIGGSSYSFAKRLRLAMDVIITFSDKPLRLTIKFGVFVSFLSVVAAITLIGNYFAGSVKVPGWTTLAVLNAFFSGAIISVLGMVGLYVGKTFESVKSRPTYIIDQTENL